MTHSRRPHPHLYEVNCQFWLNRWTQDEARRQSLDTLPEAAIEEIASHFDFLWLMGVWQRSAGSREQALSDPALRSRYDETLPGWSAGDVGASPYAVHSYVIDSTFGRPEDLGALRRRLNRRGVGLILDFVGNHLARDHAWTMEHPAWFIRGQASDLENQPKGFFRTSTGAILAHGKDPYFDPWTDTAQLNVWCKELRAALTFELLRIAESADGVRCDMAMLLLNDVVQRVWAPRLPASESPAPEFWSEVIAKVKAVHPHFLFLAEAYWGLERKLLDLGFDFVYDKHFYDLLFSDGFAIREYVTNAGPFLDRSIRFLENHDESRAIAALGRERSMAAAAVLMTLPGMRLLHDGQREGRYLHPPVQLLKEASEPVDHGLEAYYERLLDIVGTAVFHQGRWQVVEILAGERGDDSDANVLAWRWELPREPLHVVLINYSSEPLRCRIDLPRLGVSEGLESGDLLRDGGPTPKFRLESGRFTADLGPWEHHILQFSKVQSG